MKTFDSLRLASVLAAAAAALAACDSRCDRRDSPNVSTCDGGHGGGAAHVGVPFGGGRGDSSDVARGGFGGTASDGGEGGGHGGGAGE